MLAIRLQRTGRSGHAQFRVIVQDDRFSPKSGRVVAYVGNYDPHTKAANLDSEKIAKYLTTGAQPSDRVAELLKQAGIKLPAWVKTSEPQKRTIRHPEKLRRNRPPEAKTAVPETPAEAPAAPADDQAASDAPQPEVPEAAAEPAAEAVSPAEETAPPAADAASEETPVAAEPEEKPAEDTEVEPAVENAEAPPEI